MRIEKRIDDAIADCSVPADAARWSPEPAGDDLAPERVALAVPRPRRYTVFVRDSTGIHLYRLVQDEAELIRSLRREDFWPRWWQRSTRGR